MIIKFNLHRKLKELLEADLNDKVVKKLKNGGNTYCFGDNRFGKCGIGSNDPFIKIPQHLFGKFKKIFCGYHHNVALDENMVMYSWGKN